MTVEEGHVLADHLRHRHEQVTRNWTITSTGWLVLPKSAIAGVTPLSGVPPPGWNVPDSQ